MADPRFFRAQGPFSLSELASVAGVSIDDLTRPDRMFSDVAPLSEAGADDFSFLDNARYVEQFRSSTAGGAVVHPDRAGDAPAGISLLESREPYLCFAKIARAFYPDEPVPAGFGGTHAVDPTAVIGEGCSLAPGVVIGPRAEIGRGTVSAPTPSLARALSSERTATSARFALSHIVLWAMVFACMRGVRIGEAGFGFAPSRDGFVTVPQLGRVVIGDSVEIGANSTIDRGAGPDTIIGDGCRIDNLVQIGHNVRLGNGCIVVAQTGISGSTTLEEHVVTGGQVGIVGHVTIGKGVQLGAQSGVMNDIPPGQRFAGSPAVPARQWLRQTAWLKRMSEKKVGSDG